MVIFALLLGILGLLLSASFSGTETAFYRIPKLRLKLDTLAGDRTAQKILWFVNNSGLFVATILVGNNIANYTVSMAMVLFVNCLLPNTAGIYTELVSTLILTPILFVYGEMFPKYICLNAPNKILRFFLPFISVICYLFLPLTGILWGINRLIAAVLGKTNLSISMSLGRRELTNILVEGENNGILFDAQRRLAEGIFNCSGMLVKNYAALPASFPMVTTAMKPDDVLQIARQHNLLELPVYEPDAVLARQNLPVGYVRTIDLEIAVRQQLDEQTLQLLQLLQTALPIRSAAEISAKHSLLTGMVLLQTQQCSFGCVADEYHRCLGFISADQLWDKLLRN